MGNSPPKESSQKVSDKTGTKEEVNSGEILEAVLNGYWTSSRASDERLYRLQFKLSVQRASSGWKFSGTSRQVWSDKSWTMPEEPGSAPSDSTVTVANVKGTLEGTNRGVLLFKALSDHREVFHGELDLDTESVTGTYGDNSQNSHKFKVVYCRPRGFKRYSGVWQGWWAWRMGVNDTQPKEIFDSSLSVSISEDGWMVGMQSAGAQCRPFIVQGMVDNLCNFTWRKNYESHCADYTANTEDFVAQLRRWQEIGGLLKGVLHDDMCLLIFEYGGTLLRGQWSNSGTGPFEFHLPALISGSNPDFSLRAKLQL